jgi:hypothetical protein
MLFLPLCGYSLFDCARAAMHSDRSRMAATSVPVILVLFAVARGADPIDHLAAAKAAEQSVHAACDEWSASQAKGEDTSAAAEKIRRSYEAFYAHARDLSISPGSKSNIVFNALGAFPTKDIVSAGMFLSSNGDKWSYVVWRFEYKVEGVLGLHQGLAMTQWKRENWQRKVSRSGVVSYLVQMGGYSASLGIEPEAVASKFSVSAAKWVGPNQQLLRVPYRLGDTSGVIEVRRVGDRWEMKPDRGVVDQNGRWLPFGAEHPPH